MTKPKPVLANTDYHYKDHNTALYHNSSKVGLWTVYVYSPPYMRIVSCSALISFFSIILQNDATSISRSSSNTLSSNASSSTHSEEKWYEIGGRPAAQSESDQNGFTVGYMQGTSTDSSIEAVPYGPMLRCSEPVPASISSKSKEKASAHWGEMPISTDRVASEISHETSESPVPAETTENQAKSSLGLETNSHTLSDVASHSRYMFLAALFPHFRSSLQNRVQSKMCLFKELA